MRAIEIFIVLGTEATEGSHWQSNKSQPPASAGSKWVTNT